MNEEIRDVLEEALGVLESYEVQIDGEWGVCRGIEELYADGCVDDVLLKIKALLEKE